MEATELFVCFVLNFQFFLLFVASLLCCKFFRFSPSPPLSEIPFFPYSQPQGNRQIPGKVPSSLFAGKTEPVAGTAEIYRTNMPGGGLCALYPCLAATIEAVLKSTVSSGVVKSRIAIKSATTLNGFKCSDVANSPTATGSKR
jgi:hypothetical protein